MRTQSRSGPTCHRTAAITSICTIAISRSFATHWKIMVSVTLNTTMATHTKITMVVGRSFGPSAPSKKRSMRHSTSTRKSTTFHALSTWREKTWCTAKSPNYVRFMGPSTLASFQRLTFCPTSLSTLKRTWSAPQTKVGSWSPPQAARAEASSWQATWLRYLTKTSNMSLASTFRVRCFSMGTSLIWEYMSPLLVWIHCGCIFMRKAWLGLPPVNTLKRQRVGQERLQSLCIWRISVWTKRTSTLWRLMLKTRMALDLNGHYLP